MTYLRSLARSLALAGVAVMVMVQLVVTLVAYAPGFLLGAVFFVPWATLHGRTVTNRWRALIGRWSGLDIPVPYTEAPAPPAPEADGMYRHREYLYRTPRMPAFMQRLGWLLRDRATLRDLQWMLLHPVVGGTVALLPFAPLVAPVLGAPLWTIALFPVGVLAAPYTIRAHGVWTRWLLRPATAAQVARGRARSKAVGRALRDWSRALWLVLLAPLAWLLLAVSAACFALGFGLGMVFLIPLGAQHFRWLTNLRREYGDWFGAPIPRPYAPRALPEPRPDGLYRVGKQLFRTERMAKLMSRFNWGLGDVATWRDLLWLAVDPIVTVLLLAPPVAAAVYGAWGLGLPWLTTTLFGAPAGTWYGRIAGDATFALPVGIALIGVGVAAAGPLLRLHARWTRLLLSPTKATLLRRRVERLTRTRSDAIDARAAEIRRIERDLHDGAQARLVSVGLTLGAVQRLIDTDPAAARRLVAQAQETSAAALVELRDLVHGILPPVLSERGLGDAVRALALDCTVPVRVSVDLPGRAPGPVESAAYFAVSEALTNAVKHAGAGRITVDLRHRSGVLRMSVTDDGVGGADPTNGTGLRGIERRLGTFDGTLAVHSPDGGPTVVTMEVPCAMPAQPTGDRKAN